jgi:hypothetical protein
MSFLLVSNPIFTNVIKSCFDVMFWKYNFVLIGICAPEIKTDKVLRIELFNERGDNIKMYHKQIECEGVCFI